ncbi:serpin A12 [Hippopotamus amphibius kiboko]|uniref:serpin A12 n=1 Tax=Hippopotamus amphibius kiboko TaxID=575201 RepID=UPI002596BEA0|nr:serpin A12 [Hippopotamus amphibius kiboko]XP_057587834.1 serpin A12 [Hippopotamus amphibius kiboko]
MNPVLGLGLLLAGLLTVEGLLKPSFSPENNEVVSQGQARKGRRTAQELAERNTDFGLKLFKQLSFNSPDSNILFSPWSISMAFAMLSLGAQDSTLAEIKEGFNFRNIPEKDLHEGFHYLIHRLNRWNQDQKLRVGNALFIDQKLKPQKKFLTDVKKLYKADTVPTNFQTSENARKQVNDYVSQKTQGRISNLIKMIDPGTVMLLINYVFFRARWQYEFDPKATKEEDFILDRNKAVKVPMMFHMGMYEVGHDDQLSCTVLEIPYRGNITAVFILPDEGKMKDVEQALGMNTFARWKKLLIKRVAAVFVPRMFITGSHDLKKTLSYLGITKIFEERGDLTRISPHQSLKVGEAVHKAILKMDEKGTEAAAGSGAQTLPMETPLEVKMNKRFLLMIRENEMNNLLFLGKIVNPSKR